MNTDFLAELREEFGPRRKHLVAVSGGRDSVALLDVLVAAGFRKLVVCHLDHRLRGRASTADAAFVRRLAGKLGLPFAGGRDEVGERLAAGGVSLETAAREARHEFFAAVARRERCPRIFLAHHAEDQAETVLMNIARGAGLSGLSGMSRRSTLIVDATEVIVQRPLLSWRRADIEAWVAHRRLRYREDASNADASISRRNRLRHEVLPLLDDTFERDVSAALCRLAEIAGGDDDLIESTFAEVLAMAGAAVLRVAEVRRLHPALRARLLWRWLVTQGVADCGRTEVRRVESLLDPTAKGAPAKVNLPGGWHARRRAGRLFLEAPGEEV